MYTKKYKEKFKIGEATSTTDKNPTDEESIKKCKNIIVQVQGKSDNSKQNEENAEYIPLPTKRTLENRLGEPQYVPTNIDHDINFEEDYSKYLEEDIEENSLNSNNSIENDQSQPQQFIVTLDGIKNAPPFNKHPSPIEEKSKPAKRPPSPIVFNTNNSETNMKKDTMRNIPETLPKVPIPVAIKSKERCKFWPSCKSGDTCEYIHPTATCTMFPMCKFGERCLYIHPKCKFYTSCTRKDCPYSHGPINTTKSGLSKSLRYPSLPLSKETCKFFPNCINPKCNFFHPPTTLKPCKFGFACLNKSECSFSHNIPSKEKLTWHSVK